MGTEAGVIQIPGIEIEHKPRSSLPIVISSVQILGNTDSLIDARGAIDLSYYNDGLNIFYSSPSFINEKNTKFSYLLSGSNQNTWSDPSSTNHVVLLNLQPGHYRFMVRPVNIYGVISNNIASLEIRIRPAFWQTWWFTASMIALVSLVIYILVKWRINAIRREASMKSKIAETEMIALRAQMNPHFIFNCMNIIDGLITANRLEEAQEVLQKYSKLIRLVLENSQYREVPIEQDIQALQLYIELEAIRSNQQFKYELLIDEELLEENYKIPPLLLQPFVENAIVHGLRNKENANGFLLIDIRKAANSINFRIEDNGIGRKASLILNSENQKPHQPMGMRVTAKRIDLLKMTNRNKIIIEVSDLYPEQTQDRGTRVSIVLPADLQFE
jgi:sensor histidine kinase YesM